MGAEPPAYRDARGWAQVPSDKKLPVFGRECRCAWMAFHPGQRFVQQFQSGQGVADCAGHIEVIADLCTTPKEGCVGEDHSDQRQTDEPSAARSRCVSADEPYAVWAARSHHSPIQLMNMAAGPSAGDGYGSQQILRGPSHRCDVTEVCGRSAESDIGHRGGSEVEVDSLC